MITYHEVQRKLRAAPSEWLSGADITHRVRGAAPLQPGDFPTACAALKYLALGNAVEQRWRTFSPEALAVRNGWPEHEYRLKRA